MFNKEISLTLIINRVGDDRFEGEGKCTLLVALEKHLEAQSDAIEVQALRVVLVGKAGCKGRGKRCQ